MDVDRFDADVIEADEATSTQTALEVDVLSITAPRGLGYRDMRPVEIEVPPRQSDTDYKRPKMSSQRFVPEVY